MFMTHLPIIENPSRYVAIAEGVLVTLILGSTLVFNKMALDYMGPLTITGLRYFLAFLLLLPFVLSRKSSTCFSFYIWIRLLLLGISFYAIGNGAIVWGLKYIPATTCSLMLSFVPLIVLFASVLWLKEVPTGLQMMGIAVALAGSALFFSPGFKTGEPLGIGIMAIGLIGSASLGLFGRALTRERLVDTLSLTAIPLAIGSGVLLPLAFSMEGMPELLAKPWGIVLLLAVLNTACVYMLYNHALRVLAAFELSVITNLTPLVTALWAWLLLGERLRTVQLVGMVTVIIGVAIVQWRRQSPNAVSPDGEAP
ncbi:MAG: DMT family transporter [Anaerolineae bacterium]